MTDTEMQKILAIISRFEQKQDLMKENLKILSNNVHTLNENYTSSKLSKELNDKEIQHRMNNIERRIDQIDLDLREKRLESKNMMNHLKIEIIKWVIVSTIAIIISQAIQGLKESFRDTEKIIKPIVGQYRRNYYSYPASIYHPNYLHHQFD